MLHGFVIFYKKDYKKALFKFDKVKVLCLFKMSYCTQQTYHELWNNEELEDKSSYVM